MIDVQVIVRFLNHASEAIFPSMMYLYNYVDAV